MNLVDNLFMIALVISFPCLMYYKRQKERNKALEIWLNDERISALLEKSNIENFIDQKIHKKWNRYILNQDLPQTKLLKEYVNNDRLFNKLGAYILRVYYFNF